MATYANPDNFVNKIKGTNNTDYWIRDEELWDATIAKWVSGTVYEVGTIIEYDGNPYLCIVKTTSSQTTDPSQDTAHWWKGTGINDLANLFSFLHQKAIPFWTSGGSYVAGELIFYNGSSYLCTTDIASSTTAPSSDTSHFSPTVKSLSQLVAEIEAAASTTDEKLGLTAVSAATSYSLIMGLANTLTAAKRQIDSTYQSLTYKLATAPTSSAGGSAEFHIGNDSATVSNKVAGKLVIHSSASIAGAYITSSAGQLVNYTIPDASNNNTAARFVIANGSSGAVGSESAPIYIHSTGVATACTSIANTLISGNTASATTGISISDHTTGSVNSLSSGGSGSFSATVSSHVLSFSHSHTGASSSSVTVVTGKTHSVTDNGHTHAFHS